MFEPFKVQKPMASAARGFPVREPIKFRRLRVEHRYILGRPNVLKLKKVNSGV